MTTKQKKTVVPADRMRVMAVAAALRVRYHVARDMMLTGKFGELSTSGPMTVDRAAVEVYVAAKAKPS